MREDLKKKVQRAIKLIQSAALGVRFVSRLYFAMENVGTKQIKIL